MSQLSDLDVALTVAAEASELIRSRRRQGVSVAATKTSATDVVTESDRASERLVAERLRELRPDDGILGEEGASRDGSSGVRWIVDPIDGTVNYLYGIEWYAVSIAAERDGEIVAGVVTNADTGAVWAAARGQGATRDGAPIRVRDSVPLQQQLVLTGFSYEVDIRTVQAQAIARLLPRIRDTRRMGSCAIDICMVAQGHADAYVEEGAHIWDYAAAGLIAQEAGARFELHSGAGGGRTTVVTAPDSSYDDFLDAVRDCGFLA